MPCAAATLEKIRHSLPPEISLRVVSGRELGRTAHREAAEEPFATSLAPLDRLLAGGLPRGRLVEVVGRRSSGLFSCLLAVLAAATRAGHTVGLVDLGDGLSPVTARDHDIDLSRLLWVRPRRTGEALAAAEALLSGGFPLVAVDLGPPPLPGGRGAEGAWTRLARTVRARRSSLLVAAPYRVSGTAADTVIEALPARGIWDRSRWRPPLLEGVAAQLHLAKTPGSSPGRRERVSFTAHDEWPEALPEEIDLRAASGG